MHASEQNEVNFSHFYIPNLLFLSLFLLVPQIFCRYDMTFNLEILGGGWWYRSSPHLYIGGFIPPPPDRQPCTDRQPCIFSSSRTLIVIVMCVMWTWTINFAWFGRFNKPHSKFSLRSTRQCIWWHPCMRCELWTSLHYIFCGWQQWFVVVVVALDNLQWSSMTCVLCVWSGNSTGNTCIMLSSITNALRALL